MYAEIEVPPYAALANLQRMQDSGGNGQAQETAMKCESII
jgi:hypothetical protein